MTVPTLRFKEFDGAWSLKKIGDISDCIVPGRNKPKTFNGDIPWVTTPDLKNKVYVSDTLSDCYISENEAKNVGSKIVPTNSVVMSCVGDLGLFAINTAPIVINQQLHAFLLDSNKFNPIFVLNALSKNQNYIDKVATKTALPYLNKDNCNSIPLFITTFTEQTKIAFFLSAVDEKISQLNQKHRLLCDYKQGMMQKLFSQQIRFKADDGSEFGEWEEKKLGEVCRFINGRAYKQSEWEKEGIPVIRLQNLTGSGKEYYYSNLNLPDHQYCYNNDLLYMWSATFGPVFWQGEKAIFHYHIWKIEVNPQLLDKKYMYFLLDEMTEKMKRSLNGSTMLHVTKQGMEDTEKVIPSLPEQTKIANFLSAIDQKIDVVAQQIEQAKQWKKGLLQQMFV